MFAVQQKVQCTAAIRNGTCLVFSSQNVPPSVGIDALRSGRCIDSVNALEIGVGSLGQYLLGVLGAAS